MSKPVDLKEVKARRPQPSDQVAAGVMPKARQPGMFKGQIRIGPDFDGPLPDGLIKAFNGDGT